MTSSRTSAFLVSRGDAAIPEVNVGIPMRSRYTAPASLNTKGGLMFRRANVAALAAAVLAFTTSWHAQAQSLSTARPTPAASAANRGAAALAPASSPEALGFDSQRLAKLDARAWPPARRSRATPSSASTP